MLTVRQIQFVPPAPVVWADQCEAFAQCGIRVESTQTFSSDEIGEGLAQARFDIGIGVMDNVIAWNQERAAELQILAQIERHTVMRFCCKLDRASMAEVAREPIAVDSTTNGFVLVLYRALTRAGIDWRSCEYTQVGGVRHRYEALISGRAEASILVPPFDEMATARGFRVLWEGLAFAPHYPGVVVAAPTQWVQKNQDCARRYLQALLLGNAWATRPENAAPARAALVKARYTEAAADRLVRDAVPGLAPSVAGWDEVMSLRRECGLVPDPEPVMASVINTEILALASLRAKS